MKTLLITLCVALACSLSAEAGLRSCGKTEQTCSSSCPTTRWYKAKDGTYREMMPYMKALDRAEDADDMEPVLKQTQADLVAATSQIEAVSAEMAKLKADMEAQVAELQSQLAAEKQAVANQKERADKAETAHKMCIEEVAQLREQSKKQDEVLTATKNDLKATASERDSLKTAKADLEKQVSDLAAANKAAEDALKAAQADLEKMKQEAAEAKKAAIESEAAAKKEDDPNAGGEKPPEAESDPAPVEPAPEN